MPRAKTLGCPDIRVIAPKPCCQWVWSNTANVYTDITEGLKDVDVIITLRLQRERMQGGFTAQ